MSNRGLMNRGRPTASTDASHYLYRYCGGSGAGLCATPLTTTSTVFSFQVPSAITYNRRIIFENRDLYGLRFWDNGGPNPPCDDTVGTTEYPFWLAFSDDGNLTDAEIEAQNIQLSGALPYAIEIPAEKLPQPILKGGGANPDWVSIIYVHVLWKTIGLVNEGGDITQRCLRISKHDYDIKQ